MQKTVFSSCLLLILFLAAPAARAAAGRGTGPDLTITKSNNSASSESLDTGASWNWDVTVDNGGSGDAVFVDQEVLLSDQLDTDAGVSYGSPSLFSSADVTNDANIACSIDAGSDLLTCKADGASVTLLAASGTFKVRVPVTATAVGTYTNEGSTCEVDPDGHVAESDETNNTCSTVNVTVGAPDLQVTKSNSAKGAVELGGSFNWVLEIKNAGNRSAIFNSQEKVLSDVLPASGATYGTPTHSPSSDPDPFVCSISSNTLTCKISGATASYGGGATIATVTVPVTPTAVGQLTNAAATCVVDPESKVTESDESNNTCGSDDVVTVLEAPTFAKAFDPATVAVGEISTLTFTVTNPNTIALSDLSFTDSYPTGLVNADPLNVGGTCTGIDHTATAGGGGFDLDAAGAPASSACTITVDVVTDVPGDYLNDTGVLSSSVGESDPASATLTVTAAALGFSKSFSPSELGLGTSSTLRFVLDNSANAAAATDVLFEDLLPTGLEISDPASSSQTCPVGTVDAMAGGTSVTFSGGSVDAEASCVVDVEVLATSIGTYPNETGDLTSSFGNSGTAQAELVVLDPSLVIFLDGFESGDTTLWSP